MEIIYISKLEKRRERERKGGVEEGRTRTCTRTKCFGECRRKTHAHDYASPRLTSPSRCKNRFGFLVHLQR